ncbi:MAG: plastocyanin/azurin family copper-binding protein, partial [Acidimicrobiia bacterium]|nr:plastocyanin/azurin family copper-binding protein [Acidimicrobiia bacterium]
SSTETPETFTPAQPDAEPEPPPETSQMVFGSGQALWLALVTVVSVLALAVAVVAISIANGEDGATGAAPAAPSDDVTVAGGEFFFDPESVLVPADTDVRIELVNEGNLDHNWTVLEAGVTIAAEDEFDESTVVAQVGDVVAGESAEGSFTFAPGQYQVICTIAGHFSGGMRGTLDAA